MILFVCLYVCGKVLFVCWLSGGVCLFVVCERFCCER